MGVGKYFAFLVILFVNFLVMITLAFRLTEHFILEFFLLLLFILISLIMLAGIYNNQNWAYKLSSLFFIAFIINIYYMYINATHGALISRGAGFLAALGFLMAVASIGKEEGFEEVEEMPVEDAKVEPYGEKKTQAKTTFKPGKYVASKTGSVYHSAKCDWAKKVKKKNQVWLKDKKEAGKKGYKKHDCVE